MNVTSLLVIKLLCLLSVCPPGWTSPGFTPQVGPQGALHTTTKPSRPIQALSGALFPILRFHLLQELLPILHPHLQARWALRWNLPVLEILTWFHMRSHKATWLVACNLFFLKSCHLVLAKSDGKFSKVQSLQWFIKKT